MGGGKKGLGGLQIKSWGWVSFSEIALHFGSCTCHDSAELSPGNYSDVGCIPLQGTEPHRMCVTSEATL